MKLKKFVELNESGVKRILLDENDFAQLIKGKVVSVDGAEIALQDIGYMNMAQIIKDAVQEEHDNPGVTTRKINLDQQ